MSVGGEVLLAEDKDDFLGHEHVVADLSVVVRPRGDVPLVVTELKVPGELHPGYLYVSLVHLWKQVLYRKSLTGQCIKLLYVVFVDYAF